MAFYSRKMYMYVCVRQHDDELLDEINLRPVVLTTRAHNREYYIMLYIRSSGDGGGTE